MKKHLLPYAALMVLSALTGCGGSVVDKPAELGKVTQPQVITNKDYIIGPGDEIEVKFFFTPELNDRVTVRPDGNISLMFADEIPAGGKTSRELTASIKSALAPHVKQLDLSVVIRSFGSQRVFIGGEVAKPGSIALVGNQTLMQVLDEAGWIMPTGRTNEVVLIRRDAATGKEEVYPLNISKVISGEDVSQNVMVMAGDTILVPPHRAVEFDRWMDRNVRQALPFNTDFTVNRGVGPR